MLDLISLSWRRRGESPRRPLTEETLLILETITTHPAAGYLAGGYSPLNTGGITTILGGIFGVVILSVAIRAALHAHRSNIAGVLTAVTIVFVGVLVYGLATGNGLIGKLGTDLVSHVLNV